MTKVFAIAGVVIKELYRRKDFYVLFVLTGLITLVLGSVTFFNDRNIVRYLKEICLLLIWICGLVIAIVTAARQIPAERENRTIFPLLAKPVTRFHLIAGKWLGCWLATGIALAMFYIFFAVVAASREHQWPLGSYVQALSLHWAMLGVVIAVAIFGSIIFSAPSANTTIVFVVAVGLLLVARHLNKVAMGLKEPASSIVYTIYYLIPHLEFFDLREFIVHGWGVMPWAPWFGAALYGLAYTALFLLAAWLAFRRKALN